jgi:hypothetical protein
MKNLRKQNEFHVCHEKFMFRYYCQVFLCILNIETWIWVCTDYANYMKGGILWKSVKFCTRQCCSYLCRVAWHAMYLLAATIYFVTVAFWILTLLLREIFLFRKFSMSLHVWLEEKENQHFSKVTCTKSVHSMQHEWQLQLCVCPLCVCQ